MTASPVFSSGTAGTSFAVILWQLLGSLNLPTINPRGEIHKLLPQTHSPGVDYSLFIMESMEMSLEEVETSPAAPRRSFPPPICSS